MFDGLSAAELHELDALADSAKQFHVRGELFHPDRKSWTEIQLFAIELGIREPADPAPSANVPVKIVRF